MKKLFSLSFLLLSALWCLPAMGQRNENHLMLGGSLQYERGLEATLSYEHITSYHNAWEFFGSYHLQYADDPSAGHITRQSFWHSYNSWHLGVCYKPCVQRSRNSYGSFRLGVSGGSDLEEFVPGLHVGYEHTVALYRGFSFFFQVREDIVFRTDDLLRTGVALGLKVPLGDH